MPHDLMDLPRCSVTKSNFLPLFLHSTSLICLRQFLSLYLTWLGALVEEMSDFSLNSQYLTDSSAYINQLI